MGDVIQLVDQISSSASVLFDLNNESTTWAKEFKAPPPRLRRSVSENNITDGSYTSSASYTERVVSLRLDLRRATQDLAATDLQTLFRILDQAKGTYLKYQPQGASAPVFFVLERSDVSDLLDIPAQAAMRDIALEIPAQPFALGLRETIGPNTISNDPEGTNGCYLLVPTTKGDVPTPVVWRDNGTSSYRLVSTSDSADTVGFSRQAESTTLGTDTTNPGGGPDAAMSGTGLNNYRRTSFSTDATMVTRLSWSHPPGRFRMIGFVRRNAVTSTLTVRARVSSSIVTDTVTVPAASGARLLVDFGVIPMPENSGRVGYSEISNGAGSVLLEIQAARSGGTDTLDWDVFLLIPITGTLMIAQASGPIILDGVREQAFYWTGTGDPVAGTAILYSVEAQAVGGFPMLLPGRSTEIRAIQYSPTNAPVGVFMTVNLDYWPRYLHVRPATS